MKKVIFTLAIAACAASLSAQRWEGGYQPYDENIGTYERTTQRGPYLTGKFFDNWFISVGGGVNLYLGKGDSNGDFGKRLAPAIDASIGKWITPNIGLRAAYSGFQGRGNSPIITPFTTNMNEDGSFDKKFNFFNVRGDVMWNLSNTIGGYRNDRTWDFVPFIGAGVARAYKGDAHSTQFAGTIGLLNNIRLGDVIGLFLEGRLMVVKGSFDQYAGNKAFDGMTSLTAGITFKLGPKGGFKRPEAPIVPDYTPYQRQIERLERENAAEKARIEELNRQLEAERNKPAPKPVVEAAAPASMAVFFNIGSAKISDRDMINLENIANYIKQSPDKTFRVNGYADSQTGSKRRNEVLSRERAEAVANALVNLGVNRSKLSISSMGGVDNCAANPSLCRIVEVE